MKNLYLKYEGTTPYGPQRYVKVLQENTFLTDFNYRFYILPQARQKFSGTLRKYPGFLKSKNTV